MADEGILGQNREYIIGTIKFIGAVAGSTVVILFVAFKFWMGMVIGWLKRHDKELGKIKTAQDDQAKEFRALKDSNHEFEMAIIEGSREQERFMQATETARMKRIEKIENILRAFRRHKHK